MDLEIDITIDAAGVEAINQAGQTVTIVQSVVSDPLGSGNLPVAWLAFSPLESNIITWEQDYSLYATTTVLQNGATIQMTSQTEGAAVEGVVYSFSEGVFTGGNPGSADTYNVDNQESSNSFSFGMAQEATVNGTETMAPLNAVPVLADESVSFTPELQISVFLSSATNNGSVLSQVAGNACTFTLTSQTPTANLGFDDASNTFFVNSLTSSALAKRRRAA
jgi:hypothetical protein